jgi:hypothetical protein
MIRHAFTETIYQILEDEFKSNGEKVFESSLLLQYLNLKTKSANKGSKSRGAFGNHYAIYVLVEDYIKGGFADGGKEYRTYEGANFSDLLERQRELPFGKKLQNHHLNSRCNDEFRKFFTAADSVPIIRDLPTRKYWFNEKLLLVSVSELKPFNIARAVIRIIEAYSAAKRSAFESFIEACSNLSGLDLKNEAEAAAFVSAQLAPNVDARIFEIVSFAILKAAFSEKTVFWGWTRDELNEEVLVLYKTGRTNANDGGIDFVMRPIGRFFQVTETVDVRKYFLDIDKLQKFPLTFVIKTEDSADVLKTLIREQAQTAYCIDAVVERYMMCIEEIINVPELLNRFDLVRKAGKLSEVMREIVSQSMVEFNYDEATPDAVVDTDDEGES